MGFIKRTGSDLALGPHECRFARYVSQSEVTSRRPQAIIPRDGLDHPSIARANLAVSTEKPAGDPRYSKKFEDYTVLQQHVMFWDRDGDGQIFPYDVYVGFRDLGFNVFVSILSMLIISGGFSYPTRLAVSYIPDLWFRIYVHSIHKAKHGSDSGTYDTEGRFVPQNFEDLFTKWDSRGDGTLTLGELFDLLQGNRVAVDPYGWFAALFEWIITWVLIQRDGKVYKEDLRGIYDGSIFFRIREERQSGRGWHQGYGLDGDESKA